MPVHRRRLLPIVATVVLVAAAVPLASRALGPSASIDSPAVAGAGAIRGPQLLELPPIEVGATRSVTIGYSAGGRPIVAWRRSGSAAPTRTVLAVGVIHGDERAGDAVVAALSTVPIAADLDLWWVPTMNPDGSTSGRHGNAGGVDLNRNWPADWQPPGGWETSGRSNSGPAPASEPETQAMMRLIAQIGPDVTVWYHQPWGTVDCNVARVGAVCVSYATSVGMGVSFADRPGTATDWIMTAGHGVSFVVEFPAGSVSPAIGRRHAEAVAALTP